MLWIFLNSKLFVPVLFFNLGKFVVAYSYCKLESLDNFTGKKLNNKLFLAYNNVRVL